VKKLASVDFYFYWLQNVNVLLQTPIEIKSDPVTIRRTLAMILPQKSFGTAACPTVKLNEKYKLNVLYLPFISSQGYNIIGRSFL